MIILLRRDHNKIQGFRFSRQLIQPIAVGFDGFADGQIRFVWNPGGFEIFENQVKRVLSFELTRSVSSTRKCTIYIYLILLGKIHFYQKPEVTNRIKPTRAHVMKF
jgi:hypothetical protein